MFGSSGGVAAVKSIYYRVCKIIKIIFSGLLQERGLFS